MSANYAMFKPLHMFHLKGLGFFVRARLIGMSVSFGTPETRGTWTGRMDPNEALRCPVSAMHFLWSFRQPKPKNPKTGLAHQTAAAEPEK